MLAGSIGGLIGLLARLLAFGVGAPAGAIIGSLAGVLLVEYRRRREWEGAVRAGMGWLIGYVLSATVEFIIGVAMIAFFAAQALAR